MNEIQAAGNPWWKQKLVDLFAIDPRSLAVFRIGIALVLLYDLVDRIYDFEAMVLDRGILSVADARAHNPSDWSLYFLSSADWFQTLLFGLTFVSCVMMLAGCFTRIATVCTWILAVSLQARMPLILNGGDSWMRVMLFWAMFLPLGRVWSIDAMRAGRSLSTVSRNPVFSIATAAALLQIAVVYFFAGLAKWNEVWLSGDAMYYVFDQLIFLRPLGKQLLNYPLILHALCYCTLALELLAPLLLFLPWGTKYLRIGLVLLVYAFHLGIELTLNVGHFSYVAFASWMLFLPAMFWDSKPLARLLPGRTRRKKETRSTEVSTTASRPRRFTKRTVSALCACCLAFMLTWNVSSIIGDQAGRSMRNATKYFGIKTKLTQSWRMFGKPFSVDTWYVYRARLKDGSVVDLIRNGDPPSDRRPTTTAPALWNHRWKKLHNRMATAPLSNPERLKRYRRQIAEYICKKWNQTHNDDKQIVKVDVLCFGTAIGPEATPGEYSRGTHAKLTFGKPDNASTFQDELLRIESGDDPFSGKY